jgi:urease accessory protein
MQIAQEIKHHITVSEAAGHITLDYEGRFLRRKRLITDEGEAFLVELPETVSLAATDGFVLEDGRIIAILPKAEPLLKVTHSHLPRIAWHIGNRHTPCQIGNGCLLIQHDHVIEHMVEHLGGVVSHVYEPFTPLGGAYGHGRTHSHDHGASTHAHKH